jgi:hypothetical protein
MIPGSNSNGRRLNRLFQLREAVLLSFCDPLPTKFARLLHLTRRDWQDLLLWLDTSGLALYFFDRLEKLNLLGILPLPVHARLKRNLEDNSKRIDAMIAESVRIQSRFQAAGLSYAALKGFSLWPISVPRVELRSQLDLDFLVAEEGAAEARKILEDFGYRLNAVAGESRTTWEFVTDEFCPSSLEYLYKSNARRSLDLHIDAPSLGRESRLFRSRTLPFHGIQMPVLSPLDLFLGQGLHVYQHVCCEFIRTAHLVEFYRHIVARQRDDAFWNRLRTQIENDRETCVRLGMVVLLLSRVMGRFAPDALTCFTVDQLPPTASLWADLYAHRIALASFPGSKLYLLLREEMKPMGLAAKRTLHQALVPRAMPPAIEPAVPGETALARMNRYYRQARFFLFRLRFHLFEGSRFVFESIFWRQHRNGLSQ